ncbi:MULTISPECIES: hypothetical protein [Halobacterium]|uniref:hypothetical protein n=1 Tax=Halobacterium TaxID=2239 RepID=UPI00073E4E02|nr:MULTISPECIES: hypothetical protein [Halobacterium]MCG1002881.1 hypothetical protein [Halobacterium noricense]
MTSKNDYESVGWGEYLLFYHDYSMLAWALWGILSLLVTAFIIVSGPLVGTIPGIRDRIAIVPLLMMFVFTFWMILGATIGWFPRR